MEVAIVPDGIVIRDSMGQANAVLFCGPAEWRAFVAAVRRLPRALSHQGPAGELYLSPVEILVGP